MGMITAQEVIDSIYRKFKDKVKHVYDVASPGPYVESERKRIPAEVKKSLEDYQEKGIVGTDFDKQKIKYWIEELDFKNKGFRKLVEIFQLEKRDED